MQKLFTAPECRDSLTYLMTLARPPEFGALARLNRHCSKIAAQICAQKQQEWLILTESGPVFKHNGRKHGVHREPYVVITYKNGAKHGPFIKWFDAACQNINVCGSYARDRYDGLITEWLPDGRLYSTNEYVAGKRHGATTLYDTNGKPFVVLRFEHGHASI